MCLVRSALEFRMILHSDKEIAGRYFHCFHQLSVRRKSGNRHAAVFIILTVKIVEFIAVAVTFPDLIAVIALLQHRSFFDHAGIGTQTHRSALVDFIILAGHEVDDLVAACGIEFIGIGILPAKDIAGKLNDRDLHAEAQSQIRNVVFPGIAGGNDLAFDAAAAEASRRFPL